MKTFARAWVVVCLFGVSGIEAQVEPAAKGLAEPTAPLRIALVKDFESLDPHHYNDVPRWSVFSNLFEALVRTDADGEMLPSLAESWQNRDFQEWHFVLRSGVRFHDGSLLKIEDVVASLERAWRHPKSMLRAYLAHVTKISSDAESNGVVIHLDGPDPHFLHKVVWLPIVPAGSPKVIVQPVGTGPYALVAQEGRKLELQAFRDYWGRAPEVQAAEILTFPNPEDSVDLLASGEVDLVPYLPPRWVEKVEGGDGLWVDSRLVHRVFFLAVNVEAPPLSDPRVREAIDLGIDREALVQGVWSNYARSAGQVVPDGVLGHVPGVKQVERDLAEARRLLQEASPGDRRIRMMARPVLRAAAEVVAAQLEEVGFEISLVSSASGEGYTESEVGLRLWGWVFGSPAAGPFFSNVIHSPMEGGELGAYNWQRTQDFELDRKIQESSIELDPERRRAQLQEISRRVHAARTLIPLVNPMDLYGARKDLQWTPRWDSIVEISTIRRE